MSQAIDHLLLEISLMLSQALTSDIHHQKLIESIQRVFPCDACALFIFNEKQALVPVAVSGLSPQLTSRRFNVAEHPRLQAILASRQCVRFAADCELPDPFDGLLLSAGQQDHVHSCMGCSLYVEQTLVGALTLDASEPGRFDGISDVTVETVAALAAATLRNRQQWEQLQQANSHQRKLTKMLLKEAQAQTPRMTGQSPAICELKANIDLVAMSDLTVLISGETGTGKELVANRIHEKSQRNDHPMIRVNCAALPEHLAESELFGHVKGAFTGATSERSGKFELADQGTLFLDEIGELPLSLQAKLLRVIQQGELQRVGSDRSKIVNVRLIAATNRNLQQAVETGQFRADLFHRLNIFPLHVPPLRDRKGDTELLCHHFLTLLSQQFHSPALQLSAEALAVLNQYHWPGNIRQLEHTLTRAALKTVGRSQSMITLSELDESLHVQIENHTDDSPSLNDAMNRYQKQLIQQALAENQGVWAQAARSLKVDRGNLYRLGKKLGLT
ncbi:Regulatory protein LuxO [Vibrio aerogenes CECT 7868]|uniref:Regulatory protein LuxO n=1 Tax=Vibrio aerogenes CECT 7868 TaxID=1216006 RepID=A0A1M6ECN6_9VIBR|nr:nitric oxide reductase transcriptional regulator NorR [Vibrio aerogenes]SHI83267.1 Regulatory protein LuxO [Vibrio aerogenes CECT 7868]